MAEPRLQHASMTIPAGAQDTVRAFYGGILGLTEKEPPQSLAHLHLVWFAAGDGEMELHFLPDPYLPDKADPGHICLEVDDLQAYRRRLIEEGIKIIEAEPIPNRPRFFFLDPFGNRIELTTILGDYRSEN
jgi:catechol 2,3-dioxygenase-like lactoylglutathione lyase family enzyme